MPLNDLYDGLNSITKHYDAAMHSLKDAAAANDPLDPNFTDQHKRDT